MNERRAGKAAAVGLALGMALGVPALVQPRGAAADESESAASQAPRQHRDIVFASELAYGRGWFDLAYKVLDDLEKSRQADGDTKDQAKLLRARIMAHEASEMRDRAKAAERIAAARKIYEDLASRKKGTPIGTEASLSIGELYLTEGTAAANRMRSAEDPESRAQAKKDAEDKFKGAEKFFGELVEKYAAIEIPNPDEIYRLMMARFNRARAMNEIATLADRGAKEREEWLTKARDAFAEVNFEHADHPVGYEAAIFLGHVQKELGDLKGSLDAFTSAIALKDFFLGEDGKYHLDPAMAEIVARAYLLKMTTLNEVKEYQRAIDTGKELFGSTLPGYERTPVGKMARVEAAKAIAGLGDMKKAVQELEKIAAEDPNSPESGHARATIGMLQGGGTLGGAAAPDRSLAIAKEMIEKGRFVDGANRLRLLIADLEAANTEDAPTWLARCWFELGQAYLGQQRLDEAVVAFEACATRFKSSEQAPKALFSAAMALSNLNGLKPNEFDKARYRDTLKALSTGYPNDLTAKASAYLLGNERFEAKEYVQAAREFEKVSEAAGEYYDASLYQIGIAWVFEGRRLFAEKKQAEAKLAFGSARSAFEKAIKWADGGAAAKGELKEERQANLRKLAFRARCRLAEVHLYPGVKEPKKALEVAEAAEKGLGDKADAELVAEARLLAVQAHVAAKDFDAAEAAQARLAEAAPDSPRTARGYREVAVAFEDALEAAQKAKKPEAEINKIRARAADQYAAWVETTRKAELPIPGNDYVKAGDRLLTFALALNGLSEDSSFADVDDVAKLPAQARFGAAKSAYEAALQTGGVPDAWLVVVKLAQTLGFLGEWQRSVEVFEPLIASEKILREEKDADGTKHYLINPDALKGNRSILLFAYADWASAVLRMTANEPQSPRIPEALDALARVVAAAPPNTQLWWRARYDYFAGLYQKGAYEEGGVGLQAIARVNPEFDGGKYGLKPKFQALLEAFKKKEVPKGGRK